MTNVFANKLKELRERANLSYQEVGDEVGLTKQSIYKFEKGKANPSSDTVLKLSDFFRVPIEEFYRMPNGSRVSFNNIQYREEQNIPNKEKVEEQIRTDVVNYICNLLTVEKLVGAEHEFENPLAGITILNERDVRKAANTLRKKWKLGMGAVSEVVELIENKGIVVIELTHDEKFTGLSGLYNEEMPIIVINEQFKDIGRKRFTALHELAHLLLEFEQRIPMDKIEKFCNCFAGAFLLPDDVLYEQLGRNRNNVVLGELKVIKEVYGISISGIIVQAYSSAFIDYTTYQQWWKKYKEWTDTESEENFGVFKSCERATRFERLLIRAISEKKISIARGAELFNEPVDVFGDRVIANINFNLN